jgi:DNA-directed RNA polymerase subunit M/transcription elongation factor TFIIS
MANENALAVNNDHQSIRGRGCPQCGGKIIPSDRAIYESKNDPASVFPLWQCEKCGYEQMSEKPPAPKKAASHAAKKSEE